jgi:ligand-binding sensor domain-containing protein
VWVGTPDRGLIHFHQGRTDVFSEADGLSGDTVTALLQDQEGNIWAVTTNGIDRFREYAVPNISIKQGLSNTNSVSIVGAKDGSVWVATYNGLNRWKDGRIDMLLRPGSSQHPGAPKGVPYSLFEDSGGRLWFSTVLEFGYLREWSICACARGSWRTRCIDGRSSLGTLMAGETGLRPLSFISGPRSGENSLGSAGA